jgi:hypothetical protein
MAIFCKKIKKKLNPLVRGVSSDTYFATGDQRRISYEFELTQRAFISQISFSYPNNKGYIGMSTGDENIPYIHKYKVAIIYSDI